MGTFFPSRLLIYFLLSSDDPWRGAQRSIVGIAIAMVALRLWLGMEKISR
jgi:hypothetical protein